jgi:hypothetical protein
LRGVAIGVGRADGYPTPQPIVGVETTTINYLGRGLEKLREWSAEERLLTFFAGGFPDTPKDVAGLLDSKGSVERTA